MEITGAPDPGLIPDSDAQHENQWYNRDFDGYRISEHPQYTKRRLRIVCVGAGAAGLQIAFKAERCLENVELQIYDKNSDFGGTWLENRYPGCTCDIPSHSYQFTWARNPKWSAYSSSSKEIWQYFKDVATSYDLEKYVQFNTKVDEAVWDAESGQWHLHLTGSDGIASDDWCDILINGSGVLNSWKYPDVPGLEQFKGKLMHSAKWHGTYDLTGKTVAVIGGGSIAVQIVPSIQPKVDILYAFLRNPMWITTGFGAKHAGPGGTNFEYPSEQIRDFNNNPDEYVKYCRDIEGELNTRFNLMHPHSKDQKNSRELIENLMCDQLNHNDKLTKKMVPSFALGCRRMTPGSGYLQALSKPNVEPIHESVTKLTETDVVDESGIEHQVDVMICATGFDTSFTPHFKVTGRNGTDLKTQFGHTPVGYLGITARNMIEKIQTENIKSFEPKESAIEDFYNHTHELMKRLVWSSACRSWFKNGKTHGPVAAIYPGSRLHFFELLKNVRWEDYDLDYRTGNRFQFMGNGYTHCEMSADGDPV